MLLPWILGCHVLATVMVVISFLCGQWPIFDGTPVQSFHFFLTGGFYNYLTQAVKIIFGNTAGSALAGMEHYCCGRPNPFLQITYLAILAGTYYTIAVSSFQYIPGYYLSGIHRTASFIAVIVGVMLFLGASFSDPGTVTAANVSEYLAAYPYDNILYTEKECNTCKIPKPARSKHCRICNRCIARYDHHCNWMNNCIGEKNIRYFLAFLLWNFLLCIYGAIALGLVLAGQLKEHRVVYILTGYYGKHNSFSSLAPYVTRWILDSYNTQILLIVFLAIISLLVSGFFCYHARLCILNVTTNETFKWQRHTAHQISLNGGTSFSKPKSRPVCKCRAGESHAIHNTYNRGYIQNLHDIFFPLSTQRPLLVPNFKSN